MKDLVKKINWKKGDGLVPTIIQDSKTNRILMFGYVSKESLEKTIETGKVWFYSRSKNRLWMKGEESKNYLYLEQILLDCDGDALLIKTRPAGPTCHTLKETCFDESAEDAGQSMTADIDILADLYNTLEKRRQEMPEKSYTTKLFLAGVDRLGAKLMEEATETYQAASKETPKRLTEESADVLYHLLALLAYKKIPLEKVLLEIKKRRRP